jgi:hypothetical protein
MSLYQLLLDTVAITLPFMGLTHLLTRSYFQKKLATKSTLNLDSTLGRLWEIRQITSPSTGAIVVVFDEKDSYVAFMGEVKGKKATAASTAEILLTGIRWTNPSMDPLLKSFEESQKQLKSAQEKLDNEEKQLEAKREKLLQLEANEEVRLLSLSIDK